MAANKIDRINREIEKTREKITEYQNKLKGLEAQKTEAENLQIVQLVRSMRLSPAELIWAGIRNSPKSVLYCTWNCQNLSIFF